MSWHLRCGRFQGVCLCIARENVTDWTAVPFQMPYTFCQITRTNWHTDDLISELLSIVEARLAPCWTWIFWPHAIFHVILRSLNQPLNIPCQCLPKKMHSVMLKLHSVVQKMRIHTRMSMSPRDKCSPTGGPIYFRQYRIPSNDEPGI